MSSHSPEPVDDHFIPSDTSLFIVTGDPSASHLQPTGKQFNDALIQPPSDVIIQRLRAFLSAQSESANTVDNHTDTEESPAPTTSTPTPNSLPVDVVSTPAALEILGSSELESESEPLVDVDTNVPSEESSLKLSVPVVSPAPSTSSEVPELEDHPTATTTQELEHHARRAASRRVRKSKKSKNSKK